VRLDTSTSTRIQGWNDVLRDWRRKPIFGYGVTGYRFVDAQYMRVLIETGITGFAAFIMLLYSIFRLLLRHMRSMPDPFEAGLCYGAFAGFVGLLIHAVGTNTFIIVRIMEPFWFIMGIIVSLPTVRGKAQAVEASNPGIWTKMRYERT
jgi:O-antigen ligase